PMPEPPPVTIATLPDKRTCRFLLGSTTRSWLDEHFQHPVFAVDEGVERLRKSAKREPVGQQFLDIDRAADHQRQDFFTCTPISTHPMEINLFEHELFDR